MMYQPQPPWPRRQFLRTLVLLGGLTACQPSQPPAPVTLIRPRTLAQTPSLPPPHDPVVLSVTGRIGVTNRADRLDLDLTTLEQLALYAYTTYDAGIRRRAAYQGVLLSDVLQLAGMAADATTLQASALNDYVTDIPLTALQWPVMLATFRDGQRMPIAEKGPIEIVFPADSFAIDPAVWDPKWVWMLRTLDVR
ncbi:molybdopterin-dependent oxidoreductase [Chloroflexia bacterium SDU3-3]|nr:molybdopterin-dependent oxidoreductase [Chloroflexia bacterium SDU3-3]